MLSDTDVCTHTPEERRLVGRCLACNYDGMHSGGHVEYVLPVSEQDDLALM